MSAAHQKEEAKEVAELERLALEAWVPIAEKHAALSGGDIGVLDIDPMRYPAQALRNCHITPAISRADLPRSIAGVEIAATLVEPRFADLTTMLESDQDNVRALEATDKILRDGESIILVTNHLQLTDIVIVQAAIHNFLKRTNDDFRTALIISKMVSLLASNKIRDEEGDPAPGVIALQILDDDTYLSYPKTDTTSKLVIAQKMPGEISANNQRVSSLADRNLGRGALLLAMSPSGTTDHIDRVSGVCELQRVKSGTTKLMAHENAYVLPVAIILGPDGPFIKICGMPRRLKEPSEAHVVMHGIAGALNESGASDSQFVYKGPRAAV